jgi:hypothetical protein
LTLRLTKQQRRIVLVGCLLLCGFSAPLGLPWYVTVGSFCAAAFFV